MKAISFGALDQMSLDLMQCESSIDLLKNLQIKILFYLVFASKINIANLDSETLLLCFQDLRQVIKDKQIRLIHSLRYVLVT